MQETISDSNEWVYGSISYEKHLTPQVPFQLQWVWTLYMGETEEYVGMLGPFIHCTKV